MAISAGAVWEVRTTGDDAQGGFYVSGGTDYSQQDAAQLSLTDVVTNGTTTVTSVTGGFTAAMIGNGINIAGTLYQITARTDTNTVTVDRTAGAASGQTGKVGGALATPGKAAGAAVASNQVWQKSGTYTLSSGTANVSGGRVSLTVGGSTTTPFLWRGYQTTRGDLAIRPTLLAGLTLNIFTVSGANYRIENLIADGNAVSFSCKGFVTSGSVDVTFQDCRATGCKSRGFDAGARSILLRCFADGCTGTEGINLGGSSSARDCVSIGNQTGIAIASQGASIEHCIVLANTGVGVNVNTSSLVQHVTSRGNGSHGFSIGTGDGNSYIRNCISAGNTGNGYNATGTHGGIYLDTNAAYGNTGSAVANISNSLNLITLSVDPFVNPGATITTLADAWAAYALNNTAGGGAPCRAAGIIPYADLGAVQHQDSPAISVQSTFNYNFGPNVGVGY